jgi:hypothetical protein
LSIVVDEILGESQAAHSSLVSLVRSSPQNDIHVSVGRGSLGKVTVEFVEGPMNATEEEILAEARAHSDMFAVTEVDHIDAGEED